MISNNICIVNMCFLQTCIILNHSRVSAIKTLDIESLPLQEIMLAFYKYSDTSSS
jgi:hypothetical protein